MSGLYKLVNIGLGAIFGLLVFVILGRIAKPPEPIPTPTIAEESDERELAPEEMGLKPPGAQTRVADSSAEYRNVWDENLFTKDRISLPEIAADSEEIMDDALAEGAEPTNDLEIPSSLKLTGVFIAGKTRIAFFSASARGGGRGGRRTPGRPDRGRLQQRLEEIRKKRGRAGKPGKGRAGSKGEEAKADEEKKAKPKHGYKVGDEVQGLVVDTIEAQKVILRKGNQTAEIFLTEEPQLLAARTKKAAGGKTGRRAPGGQPRPGAPGGRRQGPPVPSTPPRGYRPGEARRPGGERGRTPRAGQRGRSPAGYEGS